MMKKMMKVVSMTMTNCDVGGLCARVWNFQERERKTGGAAVCMRQMRLQSERDATVAAPAHSITINATATSKPKTLEYIPP